MIIPKNVVVNAIFSIPWYILKYHSVAFSYNIKPCVVQTRSHAEFTKWQFCVNCEFV